MIYIIRYMDLWRAIICPMHLTSYLHHVFHGSASGTELIQSVFIYKCSASWDYRSQIFGTSFFINCNINDLHRQIYGSSKKSPAPHYPRKLRIGEFVRGSLRLPVHLQPSSSSVNSARTTKSLRLSSNLSNTGTIHL